MKVDLHEKRKVLHVIHGFGAGGVETWLVSAVKYLHDHPELNTQFDFLITGGVPLLFDDEVKLFGSDVFYNRYSYRTILQFRKKLIQLLKKNNYIAVHDHEDFISGWHYLLGGKRLPEVRIAHLHNPYNFVHNYVVNPLRWISFKAGRKLMSTKATAITGTSNSVMDEYGYDKRPFSNKRVNPAYCGFDTSRFRFDENAKATLCEELGWNKDIKIALFVGRIGLQSYDTAVNQKNPEFAFEVAKQLIINEQWRFIFVGYKGETGTRMERDAEEQHGGRIRFLGLRQDVPKIMSACDVFIFPSLWEGLGMVAVEAQAAGMQVIMSDSVPRESVVCRELVTVKKLEDGAESWARAIMTADIKQGNRNVYADAVRQSPFSIENSVKNLLSLYEG